MCVCVCVIYREVEKCLISVTCKCLFTYIYRFKEGDKINQLISFINSSFLWNSIPFDNIRNRQDHPIPLCFTSFFALIVVYSVSNCFISVCVNVN